jgi:hypothetical protein
MVSTRDNFPTDRNGPEYKVTKVEADVMVANDTSRIYSDSLENYLSGNRPLTCVAVGFELS